MIAQRISFSIILSMLTLFPFWEKSTATETNNNEKALNESEIMLSSIKLEQYENTLKAFESLRILLEPELRQIQEGRISIHSIFRIYDILRYHEHLKSLNKNIGANQNEKTTPKNKLTEKLSEFLVSVGKDFLSYLKNLDNDVKATDNGNQDLKVNDGKNGDQDLKEKDYLKLANEMITSVIDVHTLLRKHFIAPNNTRKFDETDFFNESYIMDLSNYVKKTFIEKEERKENDLSRIAYILRRNLFLDLKGLIFLEEYKEDFIETMQNIIRHEFEPDLNEIKQIQKFFGQLYKKLAIEPSYENLDIYIKGLSSRYLVSMELSKLISNNNSQDEGHALLDQFAKTKGYHFLKAVAKIGFGLPPELFKALGEITIREKIYELIKFSNEKIASYDNLEKEIEDELREQVSCENELDLGKLKSLRIKILKRIIRNSIYKKS